MSKFLRFKFHRLCFVLTLAFSTVGCDQVTKALARETLSSRSFSFFGDFLTLLHAENTGAFLGLGSGLPETLRFCLLTLAIAILLSTGFVFLVLKRNRMSPWTLIAASLVLAGGIGNLIDRMLHGSVTDFMLISAGTLRTGIFNVADVAIVVGTALMCIAALKNRKLSDANAAHE